MKKKRLWQRNLHLGSHFSLYYACVNPDGNTKIEIQGYSTSSKVTIKDLHKEMNKHVKLDREYL